MTAPQQDNAASNILSQHDAEAAYVIRPFIDTSGDEDTSKCSSQANSVRFSATDRIVPANYQMPVRMASVPSTPRAGLKFWDRNQPDEALGPAELPQPTLLDVPAEVHDAQVSESITKPLVSGASGDAEAASMKPPIPARNPRRTPLPSPVGTVHRQPGQLALPRSASQVEATKVEMTDISRGAGIESNASTSPQRSPDQAASRDRSTALSLSGMMRSNLDKSLDESDGNERSNNVTSWQTYDGIPGPTR